MDSVEVSEKDDLIKLRKRLGLLKVEARRIEGDLTNALYHTTCIVNACDDLNFAEFHKNDLNKSIEKIVEALTRIS